MKLLITKYQNLTVGTTLYQVQAVFHTSRKGFIRIQLKLGKDLDMDDVAREFKDIGIDIIIIDQAGDFVFDRTGYDISIKEPS